MHLKRLNQNEVKKIWDKCPTQDLESGLHLSARTMKYRQTATVLEEAPGNTVCRNWPNQRQGTPQEQRAGIKLELCTKIINCIVNNFLYAHFLIMLLIKA